MRSEKYRVREPQSLRDFVQHRGMRQGADVGLVDRVPTK